MIENMAEYKRPESKEEFDANFTQKKPLMNPTEAFYESARCLFCYDAPCITACPTQIDIPLFIKQIHTGNVEGAAHTIFDSNWLGNACSKVCPTGVLCEGACVYNHQKVKPIEIGRLQNFATSHAINTKNYLYKPGQSNGRKVAIVGAGPSGIACACELRVLGYEVTIYESRELPSGLTVYGTAPYKITNEEAIEEIKYLQQMLGFTIHYSSPVESKMDITVLEKEYDATFLGVGLGSTGRLNIPGEDLENVVGAVEFIEDLKILQHQITVPPRIIVIGGGNTAMDAASESARMGADFVLLAYRKSKEDMGAYEFEYQTAISSGVQSLFNVKPLSIIGEKKAKGVKFIRTKMEENKWVSIPDTEFTIECDLVIKATGQGKQLEFFDLIPGLQVDYKNRLIVNERFQTSHPFYFAGGDAVNGGAEVVNAAYEGKMAARGIHQYLNETSA